MGIKTINIKVDAEKWQLFKAICLLKTGSAVKTIEAYINGEVDEHSGTTLNKLVEPGSSPKVEQLDIKDALEYRNEASEGSINNPIVDPPPLDDGLGLSPKDYLSAKQPDEDYQPPMDEF